MFSIWLLMLLVAGGLCAWLAPSSSEVAKSAAQALDSSVFLLSRFGGGDDDSVRVPERVHSRRPSWAPSPQRLPSVIGVQQQTPSALVKRKRVTPFVTKRVASLYKWRCAACGELLTEDFEIDHHVCLQRGGTNDISNLRPLRKRCHLTKNSLEQRRS